MAGSGHCLGAAITIYASEPACEPEGSSSQPEANGAGAASTWHPSQDAAGEECRLTRPRPETRGSQQTERKGAAAGGTGGGSGGGSRLGMRAAGKGSDLPDRGEPALM